MDRQDVKKLFALLETLCPSAAKKPRDAATLAAWAMVLEPYTYEAIKGAAITRARENRFFPDPAELVAYLPQDCPIEPAQEAAPSGGGGDVGLMRDHWISQREARAKAGLPVSAFAARALGMSAAEWYDALEQAGIEPV